MTLMTGRLWRRPTSKSFGSCAGACTNLAPRKMMGMESNGMLLSAVHTEKGEEKLNLIMLDDQIPAGSKLC